MCSIVEHLHYFHITICGILGSVQKFYYVDSEANRRCDIQILYRGNLSPDCMKYGSNKVLNIVQIILEKNIALR